MASFFDICEVLKEKNFSNGWYNPDDLVTSMKHAIIIRLASHFVQLATESIKEAETYREFLDHVLAVKPYRTKHRGIIDLCSASAQMVIRGSWEKRQELIVKFLINDRPDERF